MTNLLHPPASFPPIEHEKRLRALVKILRKQKLDGAVVASETARFYYTGFAASSGLLLVEPDGKPRFLTDFRYLPAAQKHIPFAECADILRPPESEKLLAQLTAKWKRAGIEHTLPHDRFLKFTEPLAHVAEWADLAPAVAAQRAVKSPRELKAVRRSAALNDVVFKQILDNIAAPGVTEWRLRVMMRMIIQCAGEAESFASIAAFGANAAECHHAPGEAPLRRNQAVLLDFGTTRNHYCSDLTRTFCLGKPSKTLAEIHAVVLRANRAAAEKIRPGMTGAEADAIARGVIEKAGYGKAFGHGLGHGVGLEVHEGPSLSSTSTQKLEPGNIITIEPGIYLPGVTGVRIEDIALVTEDGCEVLSNAPRELIHG